MQVDAEFEERWNAGTVQGWEDKGVGTEHTSSRGQPLIDVDDYDSVEELLELGPDRLKEVHNAVSGYLIAVLWLQGTHYSVQKILVVGIWFKVIQIQLSE